MKLKRVDALVANQKLMTRATPWQGVEEMKLKRNYN